LSRAAGACGDVGDMVRGRVPARRNDAVRAEMVMQSVSRARIFCSGGAPTPLPASSPDRLASSPHGRRVVACPRRAGDR